MNEYTVIIEGRDDETDTWIALGPAENVSDEGTAEQLARFTADNDTMEAAGVWRVRVWDGADADPDTPEDACAEIGRD